MRSLLLVCVALAATQGCKKKEPEAVLDAPAPSASVAPDRVGPGELIEGELVVWGFRAPRDLTMVSKFPTSAVLDGQASLAQLEEYVRLRVKTHHVEVTPQKSVFPNSKINGGDPDRTYRFELIPQGSKIRLRIDDITPPPPPPPAPEEERWRRAGVTPSGKPIPGEFE
jgi:hypothetical protein